MDTKSLQKIKTLTADAATLSGFHEWFKTKYADRAHYDKQGYGFNLAGERHGAFSLQVGFSAYAGTYGSSSVYSAISMQDRDAAANAFVKAINQHQQMIFATMAEIMRKEAAALTANAIKELAALQALLDSVNDLPQAAE